MSSLPRQMNRYTQRSNIPTMYLLIYLQKKNKESQLSKQERAKEEQKPDRLADTQPLSKKQRRLLAKQQVGLVEIGIVVEPTRAGL